jgi:DNA polymerase-3 subunit alpha
MTRMTEEKAEQMLTFFSQKIDFENLPLDDKETFEIFQKADTDGIFMMESEWDKYDLLQVKPKNLDELAATLALSLDSVINTYLYTYIKIEKIKPTYPRFVEMPRIKEILSDTRGMLLWKEQKEEILEYIDSLSEEEKENYRIAIRIILREIELRSRSKTLSNRKFFRKRALFCYKLAYIKTRMPKEFDEYRNMLCNQ